MADNKHTKFDFIKVLAPMCLAIGSKLTDLIIKELEHLKAVYDHHYNVL